MSPLLPAPPQVPKGWGWARHAAVMCPRCSRSGGSPWGWPWRCTGAHGCPHGCCQPELSRDTGFAHPHGHIRHRWGALGDPGQGRGCCPAVCGVPGLGSAARSRWHGREKSRSQLAPHSRAGQRPKPMKRSGRWPRAPSLAAPLRDLFWARNEEALHSPAKNSDLSQRRVTALTLGRGAATGDSTRPVRGLTSPGAVALLAPGNPLPPGWP